MTNEPERRCRLVLIAPEWDDDSAIVDAVGSALGGGDVASIILPAGGRGEAAFQTLASRTREVAHGAGVALMVAEDTRVAGRAGADGVHFDDARAVIAETSKRFDGHLMFGAGGARTRHEAMEIGEAQPDYIFFGKIGFDNRPAPHPRSLALGEWWAQMVEIPAVVMGGSLPESAIEVAATGVDFVALSQAIFSGPETPGERVAAVNRALDENAPVLAEEVSS